MYFILYSHFDYFNLTLILATLARTTELLYHVQIWKLIGEPSDSVPQLIVLPFFFVSLKTFPNLPCPDCLVLEIDHGSLDHQCPVDEIPSNAPSIC
jgi:hypothetical protein